MNRSKSRVAPSVKRMIRCAIYTRKSTEDGLEQEFNSLDAQRLSGGERFQFVGVRTRVELEP